MGRLEQAAKSSLSDVSNQNPRRRLRQIPFGENPSDQIRQFLADQQLPFFCLNWNCGSPKQDGPAVASLTVRFRTLTISFRPAAPFEEWAGTPSPNISPNAISASGLRGLRGGLWAGRITVRDAHFPHGRCWRPFCDFGESRQAYVAFRFAAVRPRAQASGARKRARAKTA